MTIPVVHFFLFLSIYSNKTFLIMGQRLIISEEERRQINKMYGLVNEKASMDKQVAGPFSNKSNGVVKYYIYQIGSKFYIYMTNASHKEPTLMDGTAWDNDGKGYPNEMEAKKVIDSMLNDPPHTFLKMKPKLNTKMKMMEQMAPSPAPQAPLRLQVFPVVQVDGEDGSPRDVKGEKASYYIDVDTEPVNVDNKDVTFSYSVRGRKDKGEGKYHTDYKNEIVLDSCFLDEWGDEKEFTTFDGKTITCGEKEFRLSSKGREQMNRVFGTRGYVSNDKGGKDMSNMA